MLDLANVASTEDFYMHDGYSVMHDQSTNSGALR